MVQRQGREGRRAAEWLAQAPASTHAQTGNRVNGYRPTSTHPPTSRASTLGTCPPPAPAYSQHQHQHQQHNHHQHTKHPPTHLEGIHAGHLPVLHSRLAPLPHRAVHVARADVAQRGSVGHACRHSAAGAARFHRLKVGGDAISAVSRGWQSFCSVGRRNCGTALHVPCLSQTNSTSSCPCFRPAATRALPRTCGGQPAGQLPKQRLKLVVRGGGEDGSQGLAPGSGVPGVDEGCRDGESKRTGGK